jgi:hypothetical protein
LSPSKRKATDYAFHVAWKAWRGDVAKEQGQPTQEEIRLTALAVAAVLIGSASRGRSFSAQRLVAVVVISAGLAVGVGKIFQATIPLLPFLGPAGGFGLRALMAVFAGALVDSLVKFKPQEILAATEPAA